MPTFKHLEQKKQEGKNESASSKDITGYFLYKKLRSITVTNATNYFKDQRQPLTRLSTFMFNGTPVALNIMVRAER